MPHAASAEPKPFYKKYSTRTSRYIYDVNTGIIIRVTDIAYDLVDYMPLHRTVNRDRAISHLTQKYGIRALEEGIEALRAVSDRSGVLRSVRLTSRMRSPAWARDHAAEFVGRLTQLVLSVTDQCNMRCSYCAYSGGYANTRVHSNASMPWRTAQAAIDYFLSHRVRGQAELSFYGGEPLLEPELLQQCMAYTYDRAPEVTFGATINGTLLTDETIDLLARRNVRLLISLDGPEALHDRERRLIGGQPTFARILDNVRRMRSLRPEYYANKVRYWCTLRPGDNHERVVDFFVKNPDWFADGQVGFGAVVGGHRSFTGRELLIDPRLERRYLDKLVLGETADREFSFFREMFDTYYFWIYRRGVQPHGFGSAPHQSGACFPGCGRLFVKTDGTYLVCEKSNNSLAIGNVWNGLDPARCCDVYRDFYEVYNVDCCRCWAYRFCKSCYVSATLRDGEFRPLSRSSCATTRRLWKDRLVRFTETMERRPDAFAYLDNTRFANASSSAFDAALSEKGIGREEGC